MLLGVEGLELEACDSGERESHFYADLQHDTAVTALHRTSSAVVIASPAAEQTIPARKTFLHRGGPMTEYSMHAGHRYFSLEAADSSSSSLTPCRKRLFQNRHYPCTEVCVGFHARLKH